MNYFGTFICFAIPFLKYFEYTLSDVIVNVYGLIT